MRFETTASFDGDYARLSKREQRLFRDALAVFVPACDRYANDAAARWPAPLRVKDVDGALGIWQMTWSFAGPDGLADDVELRRSRRSRDLRVLQIDGRLGVRWRRIGGHPVLRRP